MSKNIRIVLFFFFTVFCCHTFSYGQSDTIRVMAYNVLDYGSYPLCQGPNGIYNNYLKTIVQYANPDIIGLEKMGSLQTSPTDHNYSAAIGFQDSILQDVVNAAYPGRYNYCPFTNYAASSTECLVLYNQQKLGFIATTCTYTNTEDFNTYKFYYKDSNLATVHDTTYLYVTDNHDISGSDEASERGAQIAGEMAQIQTHFTHLANMINMGDFNLRNTLEPVYQTFTAPSDTNFRYYDPPFYPDGDFSYPADWDSDPNTYSNFLTTSTRLLDNMPNTCGTSGGAKDWFDHIFLSPWIINNANYIAYIPHSFRVLGNDGNRVGISVNDSPVNTSAPSAVIDALFQMSNKYPIMLDLLVTPNTTGISPVDPEITPAGVATTILPDDHANIINPVDESLKIYFSNGLLGKTVMVSCTDMIGRTRMMQTIVVNNAMIELPFNCEAGIYYLRIVNNGNIVCQTMITKK